MEVEDLVTSAEKSVDVLLEKALVDEPRLFLEAEVVVEGGVHTHFVVESKGVLGVERVRGVTCRFQRI